MVLEKDCRRKEFTSWFWWALLVGSLCRVASPASGVCRCTASLAPGHPAPHAATLLMVQWLLQGPLLHWEWFLKYLDSVPWQFPQCPVPTRYEASYQHPASTAWVTSEASVYCSAYNFSRAWLLEAFGQFCNRILLARHLSVNSFFRHPRGRISSKFHWFGTTLIFWQSVSCSHALQQDLDLSLRWKGSFLGALSPP